MSASVLFIPKRTAAFCEELGDVYKDKGVVALYN
jgi:hypothetical protein